MSETETGPLVRCADCGNDMLTGLDRSYQFSEEGEICFECAMRRGGVYDEQDDRWPVPPDVVDLLEREREAEPALAE